jgi:4-amino-4-deoxy-L-arabinose transferase-like glycosyltransferase
MFFSSKQRLVHQILILATSAVLNLTTLGVPSLWDIDEGKNAEAAREMLDADNWIVPTFNYEPRFEKPVLLYWLQIAAFKCFGINEFAVRLPCALACCLAGLAVYELGRAMFDAGTGLLAGLILSSMALPCASARFANPDAILCLFTLLTLTFFWLGFSRSRTGWLAAGGISTGFAFLAKGPVGLIMPALVAISFLAWSRRLGFLKSRALAWATLAFVVTALPWYVWVAIETRGAFLRAFFLKENAGRFFAPMEHHGGPPYYYLIVLLVGLAPWSIFLAPVVWYSLAKRAPTDSQRTDEWQLTRSQQSRRLSLVTGHSAAACPEADSNCLPLCYRYLWCWVVVYLVLFSIANTKLPNYILPMYPPAALLTARFLKRWQAGVLSPPGWIVSTSFSCLFLIGAVTALALLAAGGLLPLPAVHVRIFPGIEIWAAVGIIPMLGAVTAWWCWYAGHLKRMLVCLTASAILFIGIILNGGGAAVDDFKAPRALVAASGARDEYSEIRVGTYQYFQPSLVFYCRREVRSFDSEDRSIEFLRSPLTVFLFMPSEVWDNLKAKVHGPVRLLARHLDLYRNCEVVVVTNH